MLCPPIHRGRTVIIFDGLDELLDSAYRQEIGDDVESFCSLYPSVPALITSREVGYEQAPLDEKRFDIFRLAPFDEKQVREYAGKWFAADTELTLQQRKQKADAFINESAAVSDLRANPLMLALMCNIYRGENYIPKNRPDVYEKCAVMLFERWDKARGIFVPLPFEAHISPAIKYLAHWMYADEKLQGGVTERELIAKATDYLCPRRFEDRDEGEKAAREFIDFCRGRAWVFTDTGTTREGESLYQFTHRTFLEYFTAAHLVRTHPTAQSLASVLLPRITKREWDVVAQLAFQLQNKNIEGAGDDLLTAVIKQAGESQPDEASNLLSFAARSLEFLVPSPRIIREVTIAGLAHCAASALAEAARATVLPRQREHRGPPEPGEIVGDLLGAASENRHTIADSIEKYLLQRMEPPPELQSVITSEIALLLRVLPFWNTAGREPTKETLQFWAELSRKIVNARREYFELLCRKDILLCSHAYRHGIASLRALAGWHGIETIFRPGASYIVPTMDWLSPAETLLGAVLQAPLYPEGREHLAGYVPDLLEAGRLLFGTEPPWIDARSVGARRFRFRFFGPEPHETLQPKDQLRLSSEIIFASFLMLGVYVESSEEPPKTIEMMKRMYYPFFRDYLRHTFLARFTEVQATLVQAELEKSGFTPVQQVFAWKWIRRESNLVRKPQEPQSSGPHTVG